ncbi:MAG: beta-mannanase, partial [Armatimonadetes bacterium]|nr:beta-mannanase [Armatimonadota bacterium]
MRMWILTMVLMALVSAAMAAPPKAIHLEAEDAQLVGTSIATSRPGYSGTGYVTGFQHDGDKIVFHIPDAQAGIYNVNIRYSSPSGQKGYDLVVNGATFSGMFAQNGDVFATQRAGKVELQNGPNTLEIRKGWGYYDIDAVDLVPAPPAPRLKPVPTTPVDPQATAPARALLASLVRLYGQKTLSGQYDQSDADYVREVTGKTPAILGGDFMDYSPSRLANGSDPKGETEHMIQAAKAGEIVTMSWHWNAPTDLKNTQAQPWWRGFYTDATTFDVQKALADPQSEDYRLLLRDMDAIAAQLQKFADAGVPVLWRPLHEAEGGWFWWGAKGPEPFKALWRLMYDRFTNT